MRQIIKALLVFMSIFLLNGCKYSGKNNDNKILSDQPQTAKKWHDTVVYSLPAPGEILNRMEQLKIRFDPSLLNPYSQSKKYVDSKSQSLNLGIYISDLTYMIMCKRSTELPDYFEQIKFLSDQVGIPNSTYGPLLERAKANSGNFDSLVIISNLIFGNMLEFLEFGGMEDILALISAGAYIECLYISTQLTDKYSADDQIIKVVGEMKYSFNNLYMRIKNIPEGEVSGSILNYMNKVISVFSSLNPGDPGIKISSKNKGSVSISGGGEVIPDEKSFNTIKQRTAEIRMSIVNL